MGLHFMESLGLIVFAGSGASLPQPMVPNLKRVRVRCAQKLTLGLTVDPTAGPTFVSTTSALATNKILSPNMAVS